MVNIFVLKYLINKFFNWSIYFLFKINYIMILIVITYLKTKSNIVNQSNFILQLILGIRN